MGVSPVISNNSWFARVTTAEPCGYPDHKGLRRTRTNQKEGQEERNILYDTELEMTTRA